MSKVVKKNGPARLAVWMQRRSLSHDEAAKILEVHQTTVSGLLRGRMPSLSLALDIARVTRIPVEAWLTKPKEGEA